MAKVLLADDDELVRIGVRSALERDGHVVLESHDGQSCLQRLSSEALDLCVMDLAMPGAPIEERLSAARQASVPVLVLTGYDMPASTEPRVLYARKPITISDLQAALLRLGIDSCPESAG
jgi:CheY-like chemotaxis protein